MKVEIRVNSADWSGNLVLRYGSILAKAYALARSNPLVTAAEAAAAARPFIFEDGSQEEEEWVMRRTRQMSEQTTGWRDDRRR